MGNPDRRVTDPTASPRDAGKTYDLTVPLGKDAGARAIRCFLKKPAEKLRMGVWMIRPPDPRAKIKYGIIVFARHELTQRHFRSNPS